MKLKKLIDNLELKDIIAYTWYGLVHIPWKTVFVYIVSFVFIGLPIVITFYLTFTGSIPSEGELMGALFAIGAVEAIFIAWIGCLYLKKKVLEPFFIRMSKWARKRVEEN